MSKEKKVTHSTYFHQNSGSVRAAGRYLHTDSENGNTRTATERTRALEAKKASRSKKASVRAKKPKSKKSSAAAQREMASGSLESNIVKGLSHPLRLRILTVLQDRKASPNELSKQLKEGLSQVSYHIKVLRDFEMIEQVKTEPRRGAIEHFYRPTQKVFIPGWMAKAWPRSARRSVASMILKEAPWLSLAHQSVREM